MSIAIAAVIAVAVVAIVAWPFLSPSRPDAVPDDVRDGAERLRRARADVYDEIRQLESDHGAGLVEDDDYRAQRRDLRVAAARIMRAEAGSVPATPEEQLEREIEAARRRMGDVSTGASKAPADGREDCD